jgi:ADP-ribose pyrophosphatase
VTFTIAIGMGLGEAVLGREVQHQLETLHVGRAEADRLMGAGRAYGRGSLPLFLTQLDAAQRSGAAVGLVLIRETALEGHAGHCSPLVAPLVDCTERAEVVLAAPGRIPWEGVAAAIRRLSGCDPHSADAEALRFLLLGCHTERQVLAMAILLRSMFSHAKVVVSPHLVGSATSEGHLAVLRHNLPLAGVDVNLDLGAVADFAAIDRGPLDELQCGACTLEPVEVDEALTVTTRRILQLLCLHWNRAHLKPLSGGYSGSLLMVASGWKGEARTEPMVIKVDQYAQMRREIDGYHLVKDFLGKHVPTFEYPVQQDDHLGVGMELAAMEGEPASLQDCFEAAENEAGLERYLHRLDKALALLGGRLYQNTRRTAWVSPYRAFHLHTEMQQQWLADNVAAIRGHWKADVGSDLPVDLDMLGSLLRLLAGNEDGIESDVCLVHGDLNLKNIICDDGDNVWFIDWTHSGRMPIELDFAKMENDVKFVMSKQFDLEDLPHLRRLEEYLLSQPVPAECERLPEALRFARWDLRFRKVLLSVRQIRQACFALKRTESWLLYRAALLKYALHTLSFDQRREMGECDLPQLVHALYSTDDLLNDLVMDDFQLQIRGERPPSYPPRQRLSIDLAPWSIPCPDYNPPYHVEDHVLGNDRTRVIGGWADPEDVALAGLSDHCPAARCDADGRPLHPFGRTGIAGRGALGRWGPNLSVVALVTRQRPGEGSNEVLLGGRGAGDPLLPPQGFVRPGEDPEVAWARILVSQTGWQPGEPTVLLSEGYGYDARRTDHAWVRMHARHLHLVGDDTPNLFSPGGLFESVGWYPLTADTINQIPAELARWVRHGIRALEIAKEINTDEATAVLAATG